MHKNKKENFLNKKPKRKTDIQWSVDTSGLITLEIENKGAFKKITQVLLKKPKKSFVHLDENGSFVWSLLDGKKNLFEIAEKIQEHFGEKAEPLYERLTLFIAAMKNYSFIELN